MDNEWLVSALVGGLFLVLFIGLIFFITALIQKVFIWIGTFDSQGVRALLSLFFITLFSGLIVWLFLGGFSVLMINTLSS